VLRCDVVEVAWSMHHVHVDVDVDVESRDVKVRASEARVHQALDHEVMCSK